MVDYQPACVTDTNVWIDLHAGDLCAVAVTLPLAWHAPDLVLAELRQEPSGEYVRSLGVRSVELSGELVTEIVRLGGKYLRTSVIDLAALVLAQALGAILLTGDRHLREAAEREGVEVHGTLWMMDQMVSHGILVREAAATALERMLAGGRRLPRADAQLRLRRWRAAP